MSPAALAQGATGTGSFEFTAGGLAFGDTLVFEVTVTADELSADKTQTLTIDNAESDLNAVASQIWDFESDLDGWTLIEGTFNQTISGGGANGSTGYVASSEDLPNQCDQVRSPAFQLTATSTMTLQNNYVIEDFSSDQWWDRANIAVFEGGARNSVDPDGGRLYNAFGEGATCATVDQNGWANVNNTWGSSSWSVGALGSVGRAGETIQLDVAYGTDAFEDFQGFWFDRVTVTDIEFLVADVQPNNCGGTTTTTTSATTTTTVASTTTTTTAAPTTTSTTTTTTTTTTLPAPVSVHVASIVTGTRNIGRGDKVGTATVTLVDNNGDPPAAEHMVSGIFGGSFNQTPGPSPTDGGGVAYFETNQNDPQRGGLTVTFCVSDVDPDYDPGANAPGTSCASTTTTTTTSTTTTAAPTTTTTAAPTTTTTTAAPTTTTTTAAPTTTTTTAAPTTTTTAAPTTTTTTAAPTTTTTTTTTSTTTTTLATGVHVGDLDGGTEVRPNGHWKAIVTITVFDESEALVIGAAVNGLWSSGAGGTGACETDGSGQCSVDKKSVRSQRAQRHVHGCWRHRLRRVTVSPG